MLSDRPGLSTPQTPREELGRKIEVGFWVQGGAEQPDLTNPVKQAIIKVGSWAEPAQFAYQVGKVQLP
jgi:hypothetical protein